MDFSGLNGASVLLTGGAGFIGSNLLQRLIALGARVRVFDNFETGRRENLDEISGAFETFEGDLRDRDAIASACSGVDFVLHQAALGSVPRSVENPLETHDVNVNGTLSLLEASRNAGVRRLVFASSSSVYGDTEELPKDESIAPTPISPYGVSKLAAESYCRAYHATYGLETVSLRYFNVFGPRQDPTSQYAAVIPLFMQAVLRGEPMRIFGDGEQTRDFTYVDNVVQANLLSLVTPGVGGAVVNIAAGDQVSIGELAAEVAQIAQTSGEVRYEPARSGDILHSYASIERAKAVLRFSAEVGWKQGLKRTLDWFRSSSS